MNKIKQSLAATIAAGFTALVPASARPLNICIGCEYKGGQNNVGFSVLSYTPIELKVCFPDKEWCFYEKVAAVNYEARVVLKQISTADTYKVLLTKDDTLQSALESLQVVRPELTLQKLVQENTANNNLKDGKLPEFQQGNVLTYTLPVKR